MASSGDRHLSVQGFEELLRHDVPLEYPIPGEPRVTVFIDPERPMIGLRVPKRGGESSPETGLENLHVREVLVGGERRHEVVVTDRRLFVEAYPILLVIADRIQLDGSSLESALFDTVRILGRLLQRRDSLPVEREIGIFGEVVLMVRLVRHVGAAEAVEAWRGPDGEEHDFGLRGVDLEVKTTNAERRTHWIGSLTQLIPNRGRPLWLVSYRLTMAGPDGGMTLPGLIGLARGSLDTPSVREMFDRRLTAAGWRESYETMTRTFWRLRGEPAPFAVTDDFPRLTPDLLTKAGVNLVRLPEVRYRVDLTNQPTGAEVPGFLSAALADGGLPI